MGYTLLLLGRRCEEPRRENLLAEVAVVDLDTQHRAVKVLQGAYRELARQKLEGYGRLQHLAAQYRQRRRQDLLVVHRQTLDRIHIHPLRTLGRGVGHHAAVELDQGVITHRHHTLAVDAVIAVYPLQFLAAHAFGVGEYLHLFEIYVFQSRGLFEHTIRRLGQGLVLEDHCSGQLQRVEARVGLVVATLDEQNLERRTVKSEHGTVNRQ